MMKQNYLKSLFLMLMMCIGMGAWAEEVTIDLSAGKFETDHITWAGSNCTITQTKLSGSTAVNSSYVSAPRVYKGHLLTFTAAEGKKITKVEIGVTSTYYGVLNSGSAISEATVTETGVTPSYTTSSGETHILTCANLDNVYVYNVSNSSNLQLRISSIKVTTTEGGSTDPVNPTSYSVKIDDNISGGSVTASTTSAEEGATVTLTATPATGYEFGSWNVTDASSNNITVTDNKFTMPAANVNVSATFNELQEEGTETASFIFNTDDGLSALGIAKPATSAGTNLGTTSYTSGAISMTATDGNTATRVWNSQGTTTLRVYTGTTGKEGSLTFSGATITKIEFTGTVPMVASVGTFSDKTWTGEANSVSFTVNTSTSANINSIKVTYKDSEIPSDKTLSSIAISGTPVKTTYTEGDAFDPAGLTVTGTYSDNSTEVFTEGITWSTPETLTAGQTSVKITATVNGVTSGEYTVNGLTVNTIPEKTIAEFIASEGGKCYLTGTVSNIANTTYGNFDLTDESGTIYIYGCLNAAGEAQKFSTLGVVAGDKIKVLAEIYEVYNEKQEAKNVIFVEELEFVKPQYTVTIETPENGTLTVKEGENILTSGAKVEEGLTLTIECTPNDAEIYRFKNWQYKEDGDWVTVTKSMTRVVTKDIAIRANFEEIPTYAIVWSVNGTVVKTENVKEGAAVNAPEVEAINDKVFTGWIETATIEGETPAYVTPTTADKDATYYAVFAKQTSESEITYTKLSSKNFEKNAKYVLAAEESASSNTIRYFSSYTGTTANESWGVTSTNADDAIILTLSGSADKLIAEDNSRNCIQALTTGKFRMSASTTYLRLNEDGTIYNPDTNSNFNLRYNHNNGAGGFRWYSGTTGTSAYFYKVEGGTTYSDFTTTVSEPQAEGGKITFAATDGTDYYATFSSDRVVAFEDVMVGDGDESMASVKAYGVFVIDGSLVLTDLYDTHNDGTYTYIPKNTGVLLKYHIEEGKMPLTVNYKYADEWDGYLDDISSDNMLVPCTETGIFKAEADGNMYYKLAYGDYTNKTKLGFWWGADDGSANFKVKAGGAVLCVPQTSGVKGFSFDMAKDEDAIKVVEQKTFDTVIYDMQGRKVSKTQKGLYIINGRKMVK